MRFGYKCPLILTAAAAAVIYAVTGFSFITGDEFEIPDISRVAAGAEIGAVRDMTAVPAQTETVQTPAAPAQTETAQQAVPEAADVEEQDTETAAVPDDTAENDDTASVPEDNEADPVTETDRPDKDDSPEADDKPETEDQPDAQAAEAEEAVAETGTDTPPEKPAEVLADGSEAVKEEADAPAQEQQEVAAPAAAAVPPPQPAAETGERPWERGVVHTATDVVGADYFADALFIGDSRTVGLSQYCPELDEQAEFYAKISLTVKAALDKPFVSTEEGKKTVDEMLSDGRQFGKVYIMLGINEVAGGTDESFAAEYAAMIDRIREKQPNAMIFIQSIMHVTKRKSDNDGHINNPRIDSRNAAIARLADAEKGIYYVDINQAVDDGEGNLIADLSFDEVHLKAVSYGLWYDFLKTHAHV